jgi:agmatinase
MVKFMDFKHFRAPYVFMGVEYGFNESEAVIIPVPYDSTTSYRGGTRDGPHALITASRQVEIYDMELKKETAFEVKTHTLNEIEPIMDSPKDTIIRVQECAEEVVSKGKLPITVGGEHSITLAPVAALKKKYPNLSVLQIDAHADLREEYEDSQYNHACAMKRVREVAKTVVQVGIRNMSQPEAEFVKANKLEQFIFGSDFKADEVVKRLGPGNEVYISVDLDGFDPSEVPGVGTPEPGGIHWQQALELFKKVAEKKKIVGFDIMELAPIAGNNQSEFFAAKLAYKLLGYSFLL